MKRLAKIFLLVGTLGFSALFISSPLLHNHQIDFNTHTNCPVFILNITFIAIAFTFLNKIIINFPQPDRQFTPETFVFIPYQTSLSQSNRAPPF